jgi:hypothetical protein
MYQLVHGNEALIGSVLGALILFPITFFMYDSLRNPDKYRE